ncbi:MAG: 4Fe-4S binding protein [Victivallaceae bacterium]|nr:4Fe-4S binding protein [Victivallaceae bacterium]
MQNYSWFSQLSSKQRIWLFSTIIAMCIIVTVGLLMDSLAVKPKRIQNFNINMSIKDTAPLLGVTGKGFARELDLPLDVPKRKPLRALGISTEELEHAVEHILSHRGSMLKYYVFVVLVLGGLVFLVRLGRPDMSSLEQRSIWYPRTPYILFLIISVIVAGFLLGKSPNPMEGTVKVFKCMVGLYPDPAAKAAAFLFFIALALVGSKIICGWACPFGALQELFYTIPILKKIKKRKVPFILTNAIRSLLFLTMLLFLFGIIGGRRGFVIYHNLNPFNLFNLDFESVVIFMTVLVALMASFVTYRPFCQLICPFGFISWIVERFAVFRVRIDKEKCTKCGACIKACPTDAAKDLVNRKKLPADCFSCARCLNSCPVDAIKY